MNEFWKKNKFFAIFLLLIVFLMPSSISKESDFSSKFICVGLGIDKNDTGYEMSAQVVIPEQTSSFKQKLQVYSATGKTFQECTSNLNMHVGKLPGLAHCAYLVVNEDMLEGDLFSALDYLTREFKIGTNSVLIATDKASKDILLLSSALNNNQGINVPSLLDYNNSYIYSRDPNIETVYSSILGGSTNFLINVFTTSSKDEEGVNVKGSVEGVGSQGGSSGGQQNLSSGSSSGGEGENSGGGEKSKDTVLINSDEFILMDKAQKIAKVKLDDIYGIRYINPSNQLFHLTIEDFTDEVFTNADIELSSDKKVQYNRYYVENNVPIAELNITQFLSISGVKQDEYSSALYVADEDRFSSKLTEVVKQQILSDINSAFKVIQENNCDLLRLYDGFNKHDYQKFQDFLNSLPDKKDYFKHVQLKINLNIMHYEE